MIPNDPVSTSTTIEDDGPKWRAIAFLLLSGALIIALTIAALVIIDRLQLDQRASLAIAEAARVAQETRSAKIFFWTVVWVSAALVVIGAAAAALAILAARAYMAIDRARYAHKIHTKVVFNPKSPSIHLIGPPAGIEEPQTVIRGSRLSPRQETQLPQSSMIHPALQDRATLKEP
jgi:hypothetical protein